MAGAGGRGEDGMSQTGGAAPPTRPPRVMFLAGENSGDLHAARVVTELLPMLPAGSELYGFGGRRMEAAGMRLDFDLAGELPVFGFSQVVRHYPKLRALMARARELLAGADLLVLVDYPGFNLRLARHAKALGVPVAYYISPQVWAWKKGRLKTIAACVDRMLVIFPFEVDFYRAAGVPAVYVGHPLLDDPEPPEPASEVRARLGVSDGAPLVGLIPGSRRGEVERHLPVMLAAAVIVRRRLPDTRFAIPLAGTVTRESIDAALARFPDIAAATVVTDGGGPGAAGTRAAMDFAMCKSGTSTLELALLGVPMVIVYKMSWITWIIIKALVTVKFAGLVNIVAGRQVSRELLQEAATPRAVASEALRILTDPAASAAMKTDLAAVKDALGGPGASRRAAEEIAGLLG